MAKSRNIGNLYAELTLKDQKFQAGVKRSESRLKKFGAAAAKWGVGAAAAGIAALGVTTIATGVALSKGTLSTLDQVDALGDLSNQTGLAIGDLMKLQRAYKDGGREAEMLGKDVGKMQKSLVTANSGGDDPFSSMGLAAADLLKLNPAQQFEKIGNAIMSIQNPAERTAKAMAIFGKGGMGLMTIFPGIAEAAMHLGRMPELAQKFSGAMGEANDIIGRLPSKSDQFFVGFTSGIIGTLLPNLQKVDGFDFTTIGQNLGTSIAAGIQMITSGDLWIQFLSRGEIAALELGKMFEKVIKTNLLSVPAMLETVMQQAGDSIANFTGGEKKGKSFSQNLQSMSGKSIFQDEIDSTSKMLDQMADRYKKIVQDGNDIAAAKYPTSIQPKGSSDISGEITDAIDKSKSSLYSPDVKAPQAAEIASDPLKFVDSYQKRGLGSMTNNAPSKAEEKQVELLQSLTDLFRKASLNGLIQW